tara:strand:- start:81 stop:305 length:225 start_codon:yes stop_codon:yes gene_type:complete
MDEKDMAPVIEKVLEDWAKTQPNLASSCARRLIAESIASAVASSVPVAPSHTPSWTYQPSGIDPFELPDEFKKN